MSEQIEWFVIQAMYGRALKGEAQLRELGIECFVPMEYRLERGVNRLRPILSNLLFAETTLTRLKEVCAAYSYMYYRCDGGVPMVVPHDQMRTFIDFVKAGGERGYQILEYIDPEIISLKGGEAVRIIKGAFEGQRGVFVKLAGRHRKQIVVAIDGVLAVSIKDPQPWSMIERIETE